MNFRFNQTLRLLAIAGVVGSLAACGGGGGGKTVVVPPVVEAADTVVAGVIVDSVTGAALSGQTATITLGGTGAVNLVDGANQAVTSLSTTTGVFSLALKAGVVPSATAPIDFTVSVTRTGYLPVTTEVKLVSPGTTNLEIRMLPAQADNTGKVAALTTDASTAQQTQATVTTAGSLPANTGGTDFVAKVTYTPPATETKADPVVATITVPSTVVAGREVNGSLVPAPAGPVTVQVITGNPSEATTAAPSVLPLQAPTVAPSETAADINQPTFQGYAKFNIFDSAGNPINKFSQPITLSMEMQADSVNGVTGNPYQIGDQVDIATYDEKTTSWVPTGNKGTVVSIDPVTGNRKVEFKTDHLSWFSFWFFRPYCSTRITLNPSSSTDTRVGRAYIWTFQPFGWWWSYFNFGSSVGFPLSQPYTASYYLPRFSSVYGYITDARTGAFIRSFSTPACGSYSFTVPAPVVVPGNLAITTREQCPDGSNNRVLPATVTVSANNRVLSTGYTGSTGSLTLNGFTPGSVSVNASWINSDGTRGSLSQAATVLTGQTVSVPLLRTMSCQVVTGGMTPI